MHVKYFRTVIHTVETNGGEKWEQKEYFKKVYTQKDCDTFLCATRVSECGNGNIYFDF